MTVSPSHSDHLLHHLLCHFLPQAAHHETQLLHADQTIAVLVEHLEGFSDLFLAVCVLHHPDHHSEELSDVNGAVAIRVHLIDHILQLRICGVHTE